MSTSTTTAPKKSVKKSAKKTAKKGASKKVAKKTTKKKATEKVVKKKPVKQSSSRDDARAVAKASNGKLNIDQVRVLRALAKPGQKKEMTRGDLKEAVGIGRDGMYSGKWLKSLWALAEKGFITTPEYEEDRLYYHTITSVGKKALASAEKAHKSPPT